MPLRAKKKKGEDKTKFQNEVNFPPPHAPLSNSITRLRTQSTFASGGCRHAVHFLWGALQGKVRTRDLEYNSLAARPAAATLRLSRTALRRRSRPNWKRCVLFPLAQTTLPASAALALFAFCFIRLSGKFALIGLGDPTGRRDAITRRCSSRHVCRRRLLPTADDAVSSSGYAGFGAQIVLTRLSWSYVTVPRNLKSRIDACTLKF